MLLRELLEAKEQLDVKTLTVAEIAKIHKLKIGIIQKELLIGIAHEKEHTSDSSLAREIALDHLKERPDYYSMLEDCEDE